MTSEPIPTGSDDVDLREALAAIDEYALEPTISEWDEAWASEMLTAYRNAQADADAWKAAAASEFIKRQEAEAQVSRLTAERDEARRRQREMALEMTGVRNSWRAEQKARRTSERALATLRGEVEAVLEPFANALLRADEAYVAARDRGRVPGPETAWMAYLNGDHLRAAADVLLKLRTPS